MEYNVSEGSRIEVCVGLRSGTLEKDVVISIVSSDGIAKGIFTVVH